MLHLARKAFYPNPPPFPLLHVDTTWSFRGAIVTGNYVIAWPGRAAWNC